MRLTQLEQLEALYSLLDDDGSGSLTVHEMIVSAALPAPRVPHPTPHCSGSAKMHASQLPFLNPRGV